MKIIFKITFALAAFLLSTAVWAATINIHLRDSDNNALADGGTAVLKYHDGSWHTATNDGSGNFTINTAASSVTYKMEYNHASEQKVLSATITDVVFNTVTTNVSLKDSDGTPLAGGTFKHHQANWSASLPANTPIELLPGNHTFKMSFNHASQQMNSVAVAGTSDEVPFVTVTTDVSLKDSDGNPLAGGTFKHHQANWSASLPANTPIELLPGNHTFKMSFNHGSQQMNSVSVASTSDEVPFVTVTTNVSLKDSDGNPLAGGTFKHHQANWSASLPANTPIELLPGNHTFKMSFNHGSQQMNSVSVAGTSDEVPFVTVTTTAALKDCNGSPVAGGMFKHHQANWSASLPANAPIELLPGNHTFKMSFNHGSVQLNNQAVAGTDTEILFTTTEVSFNYPGVIKYHQTSWGTYSGTMHLLPGNYTFKFDNYQTNLSIGGCTQGGTVAILNLKDHNGSGLSGGKARGGYSANTINFHVSGSTNSNGQLFYFGNGSGNMTFEMRYNGTKQTLVQDVDVNPVFDFQTAELRVRMETCSGDPVDGGTSRFKNGTHKYWLNNNVASNSNTGDAGPGEAAGEVFPGTYDVDMQFRYGQNTNTVVVTPAGGMTTFKTTNVDLDYSGSIKYRKLGGNYLAWYSQPSMEFLPGDYEFLFTGGGNVPVSVGPCGSPVVINAVFVKLENSNGTGIAGATAKYYRSGWKNAGTTDANGFALVNDPLLSGNTKFRIQHAGHANEKWQDISSNAVVVFATTMVNFDLVESDGSTSIAGATTKYYGSGWKTFGSGSTSTSMELLPGNIKFRVEHAGLSNEKWQNVGNDPNVVFQTVLVNFDLIESDGITSIAGATTKYYGSGWKTFGSGSTSTSMELLPNNIKFRVEHGGLSNEKWQNVGNDPNVVFQTVLVNFVLKNSHNTQFLTPDATKYYGSGWKNFTAPDMELLPGNIKFRVEYRGHANEKWQNIGSDPNVQFNTQKRVLSITNTTYGLQPGLYKWKYYGSGWKHLNPANTGYTSSITYSDKSKKLQTYSELLPGNVKFRVETPCGNAEQWSTLSHITIDVSCDLSAKSAAASAPNQQTDTSIKLYPNPASSEVTVEATGEVSIFDGSGKLMFIGEAKTIDVSHWAPGLYLVRTTSTVEKLIIK